MTSYDQWKTASPFDDEQEKPVVENAVPYFPLLCPNCTNRCEWQEEVIMHDGPGAIGIGPEGGFRGWHCEECDWDQECDDDGPAQSSELKDRIRDIEKRLTAIDDKSVVRLSLDDLDFLPDGDFDWTDAEFGESVPSYCDDCGTFHSYSYATDFSRKDGVLTIEMWSCDQDGDRDCYLSWSSDDGEFGLSEVAYELAEESNTYFKTWARYWLWCAENLSDPLEAILKPNMIGTQWIEFCIKAALENLEYLERK